MVIPESKQPEPMFDNIDEIALPQEDQLNIIDDKKSEMSVPNEDKSDIIVPEAKRNAFIDNEEVLPPPPSTNPKLRTFIRRGKGPLVDDPKDRPRTNQQEAKPLEIVMESEVKSAYGDEPRHEEEPEMKNEDTKTVQENPPETILEMPGFQEEENKDVPQIDSNSMENLKDLFVKNPYTNEIYRAEAIDFEDFK